MTILRLSTERNDKFDVTDLLQHAIVLSIEEYRNICK